MNREKKLTSNVEEEDIIQIEGNFYILLLCSQLRKILHP